MTPAEANAKIEAVVELIASRTMGERTDDEVRAMGELEAKALVDMGLVVSARYDHDKREIHVTMRPSVAHMLNFDINVVVPQ